MMTDSTIFDQPLFEMVELQIDRPSFIFEARLFRFWVKSLPKEYKPENSSRIDEAVNCLLSHLNEKKYSALLIWPDFTWSAIYDSERSVGQSPDRLKIFPGVIKEAYYAAHRGLHFMHTSGRARKTWSSSNELHNPD